MTDQKIVLKNKSGFCVVTNEIAQGLRKHTQALGLYVFLLSLPDDWDFYKSWLLKETGVGIHKLESLLKFLHDHNLIKKSQKRLNGRYSEMEIEILDVKSFKYNELEPLFNNKPTVLQKPYYGYRTTVIIDYKEKNNKVNINKESSDEKPLPVDNFLNKETFQFKPEEMTEAIQRDIDIQKCFNKFLQYKPKFKRREWDEWFKGEKNGKKAKNLHLEQELTKHEEIKRLEMGGRYRDLH